MIQLPGEASFICINQNEFLGRKQKKVKEEEISICACEKNDECGAGCLNVITSTECTPGYCPCDASCKNRRFQKCEYAKTKLFMTEGRGWGLLADEKIKAGQFIIEYCGEIISSDEASKRSEAYESRGLRDAYIISLTSNTFIDATAKGSPARFINHSCQPNCETRKWTVLGEMRVGIFAKEDIDVGTELAYDYNFEWYGGANVRCLCGARNCCKFLGAKSSGFQEWPHRRRRRGTAKPSSRFKKANRKRNLLTNMEGYIVIQIITAKSVGKCRSCKQRRGGVDGGTKARVETEKRWCKWRSKGKS